LPLVLEQTRDLIALGKFFEAQQLLFLVRTASDATLPVDILV
jgi:hypothetical protein